jgi:hypothetical protein
MSLRHIFEDGAKPRKGEEERFRRSSSRRWWKLMHLVANNTSSEAGHGSKSEAGLGINGYLV